MARRSRRPPRWTDPEGDEAEVSIDPKEEPRFHFLTCNSPIERTGAIYALRMMEGARLCPNMVQRGDIRDHDLLSLIGVEMPENRNNQLTPKRLAEVVSEQHRRLTARGMPRLTSLDANIARLTRAIRLNTVESGALRLAVVISLVSRFNDLFNLGPFTPQDFCRLVHHAIGQTPARLHTALAPAGTLRRVGLLRSEFSFNHGSHPLEMDTDISALLLSPRFDEQSMLRHLLRVPPAASLSLADYPDSPDMRLLQRYLRTAIAERRAGVNVLIYGPPGTGKTEFVRTFAKEHGLDLSEVPAEDNDGDAISGQKRFRAFSLAQNLLAQRRSQLLLFDEVEDVFGRGMREMDFLLRLDSRRQGEGLAKAWINQALETNPVPTVWVCNRIDAIDPAHLRRFDLTIEFRTPTQKTRRRIVERHFAPDVLSQRGIERLATMNNLPPAQVERAARVVRSLGSADQQARDEEAERAAQLSLRAMGLYVKRANVTLPAHYDPAFLNADRDLDTLARGLRAGRSARLCLFGPPGTGKTAFGHHLAKTLDKPLHVKRASDLISMWLGETEKNIAKAFDAAGDEGAILLIDEADSFLQDRNGAQRGWEVSQVNEMLTQMESFEGLFIASTNLVDRLDAASLRRFDFKIRFDYLKREQRRALFERVADPDASTDTKEAYWRRLDRMDRLVPGDIANVLRQLRTTGEDAEPGRLLDLLEAELRLKPGAAKTSIGFMH
jgi:transitional endoplasmic reticulum ATPase